MWQPEEFLATLFYLKFLVTRRSNSSTCSPGSTCCSWPLASALLFMVIARCCDAGGKLQHNGCNMGVYRMWQVIVPDTVVCQYLQVPQALVLPLFSVTCRLIAYPFFVNIRLYGYRVLSPS